MIWRVSGWGWGLKKLKKNFELKNGPKHCPIHGPPQEGGGGPLIGQAREQSLSLGFYFKKKFDCSVRFSEEHCGDVRSFCFRNGSIFLFHVLFIGFGVVLGHSVSTILNCIYLYIYILLYYWCFLSSSSDF